MIDSDRTKGILNTAWRVVYISVYAVCPVVFATSQPLVQEDTMDRFDTICCALIAAGLTACVVVVFAAMTAHQVCPSNPNAPILCEIDF